MKKIFMKKFLVSGLLAAVSLVSLTACGNNKNDNENNSTNPIQEMVTNAADDVSRAAGDVIDDVSRAAGDVIDDMSKAAGDVLNGTSGSNGETGGISGGAANDISGSGTDDWRGLDEMMSDAAYSAPNGNNR